MVKEDLREQVLWMVLPLVIVNTYGGIEGTGTTGLRYGTRTRLDLWVSRKVLASLRMETRRVDTRPIWQELNPRINADTNRMLHLTDQMIDGVLIGLRESTLEWTISKIENEELKWLLYRGMDTAADASRDRSKEIEEIGMAMQVAFYQSCVDIRQEIRRSGFSQASLMIDSILCDLQMIKDERTVFYGYLMSLETNIPIRGHEPFGYMEYICAAFKGVNWSMILGAVARLPREIQTCCTGNNPDFIRDFAYCLNDNIVDSALETLHATG